MYKVVIAMRKLLLLVAVALVSVSALAGTRDEFARDYRLSANNYRAYPDRDLPALTPAPQGYSPVFINHYARHGSRWLINGSDYSYPVEVLSVAEREGKLTRRGSELLAVFRQMLAGSKGRLGELTSLGAEQHRGIARRMMANFPEVFAGDARVTARSTVVIRCILSMQNEVNELQSLNPRLRVTTDASEADMRFMNFYPDSVVDDARAEGRKLLPPYKQRLVKPDAMLGRLFTDRRWASSHCDPVKLMINIFDVVSNAQSHHEWEKLDLYKGVFTLDEIYDIWRYNNMSWYIRSGSNPLNDHRGAWSQRNLLRDFVARADAALATGEHGAALRFGHEGNVIPLVCLMGLNGSDYSTGDLDAIADRWQSYKIFPMACNVQMIFYRNAAGDVLVKILLNEREATVDAVATDCAPYYHWQDLRTHFLARLR